MTKVAYNACYGGFSLSDEAVRMARNISGNPQWGNVVMKGEHYSNGKVCDLDYKSHNIDVSVPRHDAVLIAVIEALGDKANGRFARLAIAEIDGPYRIDEYDGFESVETPESYDWIYPEADK